jgi:hypothetical protein
MDAASLRLEVAALAAERAEVEAKLRGGGRTGRPGPPTGRLRSLLSSVVVAVPEALAEPESRELKRSAQRADDDPALKKRNVRMFGSLMQTLAKAKEEEKGDVRQELSAKRATILQRAEEREREESKRLRELERGEAGEKRRQQLALSKALTGKLEEKRLQLAHVSWLEQHKRRASYLLTAAAPSLYYRPALLCEAAQAALEVRQAGQAAEVSQAEARLEEALAKLRARDGEHEEEEGELLEGAAPPPGEGELEEAPQRLASVVQAATQAVSDEADIDDAAEANPCGLQAILG